MGLSLLAWLFHILGISWILSPNLHDGYHVAQETLVVDGNKWELDVNYFWKSTGLCPPLPHSEAGKFLLSQDMTHNLAYIGAIPHRGIEQVRIHYLLDLVKVESFQDNKPVYNFTQLDDLIQLLWENGLRPGFELMGNPSRIFTDFENKTQLYMWRDLVKELAENYIAQYGLGYVSTWIFETWNEPEHKRFDGIHVTTQGFLNYYDACSEGLRLASPLLKFGGPGGACRQTKFCRICWLLLDHVSDGVNYFTGERGVRMDFIAFHQKGGHTTPNVSTIVEADFVTIQKIHSDYPKLRDVPIFNDEGDSMIGWSKPRDWRGDARYPAMITKVISDHQTLRKLHPSIKFTLLSNDNAFLNYNPNFFTQRTLLARFQMNNTDPPHVQFVRKPAYALMGLLSLLGERQLHMELNSGKTLSQLSGIAALHLPKTTSDSVDLTVVLANSNNTDVGSKDLSLDVMIVEPREMRNKNLVKVEYLLDQTHGNPYSVWQAAGKPATPSWQQFKQMREAEGFVRVSGPEAFTFTEGRARLRLELPMPSVYFIHICDTAGAPPDQVTNISIRNVTSGQVLITWSDSCVHSRCLLTYEVEYSSREDCPFHRINLKDDIFNVFHYSPHSDPRKGEHLVRGSYRVRAVDYTHRSGEYSLVTPYGR